MKTPVTIQTLLVRIKKEVAEKDKISEKKKAEARIERARRQVEADTIYERPEMWTPVAIHREYEVQTCDCCKTEQTMFSHQRVELQHKLYPTTRKWIRERGEALNLVEDYDKKVSNLPMRISVVERVIPECFSCITIGRICDHLWKGNGHAQH